MPSNREISFDSELIKSYRYSFNGKEKDNESFQGAYDFGARILDARLGRWMSVDLAFEHQPQWSTYKSFKDNPIIYCDPDGNTEYLTIIIQDLNGNSISYRKVISDDVMTDGSIQQTVVIMGLIEPIQEYFDFETTLIFTFDDNGDLFAFESNTKIHYTDEPKDIDYPQVSGYEKGGYTKDPDGINKGPDTQSGGIWCVSRGGGVDPTKIKQKGKHSDAEMLDVEDLITALDKGVRGTLSKPKNGDGLNNADLLNHIFGIVEEGKEMLKKESEKTEKQNKIDQQSDSINVNFTKVTKSGHHFSSKNVAIKDTVGGVIKGDKSEIITKVNK